MSDRKHELQEQLKAAYALNMCTVSVSQIVDYNDEYILEQEYEAILNNLNLEQIPKDEALLNILTKLLNVITFFRIDKLKRERIEKKYQRRVKNAIWSAVPNIGVIVAGNPLSIGLSLATQVGIGYMNYRREKANAMADKEDAEIELKITAMEQFNALRRELFTTAWRLADEYRFPDKFRLTERQIAQYNSILMDPDEIRKYERLDAVQDKFEAYLPFWYFMGHSAKYIAEDKNNGLDNDARDYYFKKAKEHFEKYYELNAFSLLREDEITASFALEYTDLLLLEENPDIEKITSLVNTAVNMAGNANDILEMCAIAYLKIGQTDRAAGLLRILVNEDYDPATNAKLLSRIYVSEYLKNTDPLAKIHYDSLASRVSPSWLFPMPEKKNRNILSQDRELTELHINGQRIELKRNYNDIINQFIDKYVVLFNHIIPAPISNALEGYFANTDKAAKRRMQDVFNTLAGDKKNDYIRTIKDSGFRFRYIELINDMFSALDKLTLFSDSASKEEMIQSVRSKLEEVSDDLKDIQVKLNNGKFTVMDYIKLQNSLSFQRITQEFFDSVKQAISDGIDQTEALVALDDAEYDLTVFCREQGLAVSEEVDKNKAEEYESETESEYIPFDVLGENEKDERFDRKKKDEMVSVIRKAADSLLKKQGKVELLIHGTKEFDLFFKNAKLKDGAYKVKTLAVLDDQSRADMDLLITYEGVVPVKHNKVERLCPFDEIKYQGNSINLKWPEEYANSAVDIGNFYQMLEKLSDIYNSSR